MDAFVSPIRVGEREILIVYDNRYVTWLDATDLAVRAGLLWYIEKHPESGVIDLLNYCLTQDLACGLVFDGGDEGALLTGPLS